MLNSCLQASTSMSRRVETAAHRFAEALAFYKVNVGDKVKNLVVYTPLELVNSPLKTVIRGTWPKTPKVYATEVDCIRHLVGIWESPKSNNIYVLRKHPGLDLLEPAQYGLPTEMEEDTDEID